MTALWKEDYYSRLARGDLSKTALEAIGSLVRDKLFVQTVDERLLLRSPSQQALPSQVRHLLLQVASRARNWNGLVVGFPGTSKDLSTSHVGTPFLRMVLYPILELHARVHNPPEKSQPSVLAEPAFR